MAYSRYRRRARVSYASRSRRRSAPRRRRGVPGSVRRYPRTTGRNVPLYIRQGGCRVEAHTHTIGAPTPIVLTSSTTPVGVHLNAIPQGDGSFARDGARCSMKTLHLIGNFHSATTGASIVGMTLVYDKAPRGSVPAFDDIFTNVPANPVFSFARTDTRDRFQILFRKEVVLAGSYLNANEYSSVPFDIMVNISRPAAWTQANVDGSIAGATTGAVYLYVYGDQVSTDRKCTVATRLVFAA